MGVHFNHTTIMLRVHRYVLEYEKRRNRRAKPVGCLFAAVALVPTLRGLTHYANPALLCQTALRPEVR